MESKQSDEKTTSSPQASDDGGNPGSFAGPPLSPARKAWVENVSILLKYKYLIITVSVVATAITGVYAFTQLPNFYKARAVILPARHEGGALDNATSGLASTLKDIGISKLGGGEESYTPLSLLRSRELMEAIVKKFNFQKIYKDSSMEDAIDDFSKNLDGEVSEEGNFIITFQDISPSRAAQVTNAAVEEVNNVNSRLAKDEAEHNITYVSERYQRNLADLDSAEHAFLAFQRKYGLFSLTDQARAEMTAIAGIEEEKMQTEIQMHNAEQMHGANSADVAVYKGTIDELESKLANMKVGMDANASSFVPTNVLPDVALQYLSLTREFEIQSKIKGFLLPAYEQAKLDESKTLYGFVTLDSATVPVHKAGPHRSTLLLGVFLGSATVTAILVLLLTGARMLRLNFARDKRQLGL
jgi:capsule polysaccharide export protein KpsE/RkpR